jgi:hypothetical protein
MRLSNIGNQQPVELLHVVHTIERRQLDLIDLPGNAHRSTRLQGKAMAYPYAGFAVEDLYPPSTAGHVAGGLNAIAGWGRNGDRSSSSYVRKML